MRELSDRDVPVRLDVVLVGDDPASTTYVNMKQRDCDEVGIESIAHRYLADVRQEELAALVERLNAETGGLRVLYPASICPPDSTRCRSSPL